ncbi:uncharacterized protein LOC103280166 isoform X2 [Anolis carolinensis]|uniref:uncharacterized protein LOC103280166 isoform X2 n=1 Tax=Anolis carolinensis TaxID=28377 RepID=UPI00046272AA|nr:PREDICTED: uncharacterized protein LOC103280166 isoform X2 [Anolis carolinensis]|eukprot:XP_008116408.1 PREDICTED: uncharacterized protein LOC103280166 isoform X2 [Anolis carolinensis]
MVDVEKWLCRIMLLFLSFHSGTGGTQLTLTPPGFIETACFNSMFWMKLDESFLQKKYLRIEIINHAVVTVLPDKEVETRCGYVLSEDVWGNRIFRASFLGCHVTNERDERFTLTLNIKVSSFEDMRAPMTYQRVLSCPYFPWAPREIVCEENYMEVSVKTDVPVISDVETEDWMPALPETEKVAYQVWQLIFYSPSGRKTTVVSDASKLGYSFNNTLTRVFLRSPYSTNESEHSVANGVTMSTVSSTSMYKQRWLLLLIDTTVSCPADGTSFTDTVIRWTVPTMIPRLVLQAHTFTSLNVSMGVGGKRIENPEKFNYVLENNHTHVGITIPIGAFGGRFKSTVSNGIYGMTWSIDLFLEHTWSDTDWQLTKYTVIKPITTPFMPQIPTVVNNTIPETRVFDVMLGVFLPDVTLVILTIGGIPLTLKEAEQKNYKISDTPFPTGMKGFKLEVPFDDPIVQKEYVNKNETKYNLRVNYTLNVGPEKKLYHHFADIECIIADIVLPEGTGYCDKANMYLVLPTKDIYKYWSLHVGNRPLNQATAFADGYFLTANDTHLVLQVPVFAPGIIYEEVSFERIQARFDLTLKKIITMETVNVFSIRCSFYFLEFVVCYPNGIMTVSAVMKTVPSIDMSKTRLKDRTCKPKEFTKERAFFQFHVSTCGTLVKFEGDHLIYENEISFERGILPVQGPPTITRDPEYRLTVFCYYSFKETLTQRATIFGSASEIPQSSGFGPIMTRSNIAGHRRVRQALNVMANIFTDESFTETYGKHSVPSIYLWEPMLLEVQLKDEAPGMELYLDNCWITESEEFNSISQWKFIANGCEDQTNGFVNFYSVLKSDRVKYPKHFKRVGVHILNLPLRKISILKLFLLIMVMLWLDQS